MPLLNAFFHGLHIGIILLCLFGWIFPAFLVAHLVLCGLTLGSWFVLGLLIRKPGYCLVTGIQAKLRRGVDPEGAELENYMHYLVQKLTRLKTSASKIDMLTQVFLYSLTILSVVLNHRAGLFG